MEISESQYKFNLALDMIYYLTKLVLTNYPNKAEMVNHLIDKWDARINTNLNRIRQKEAVAWADKEDMSVDAAAILVSAHQMEVHVLKHEFKEAVKKVIINTLTQEDANKK